MKTTTKDSKLFNRECSKWINRFGLFDWDIDFCHDEYLGGDKVLAWCDFSCVDRTATIGLSIDWRDRKVTNEEIRRLALHEVLELLLGKYNELMDERYIKESEVHEAKHIVIQRLINGIWKK